MNVPINAPVLLHRFPSQPLGRYVDRLWYSSGRGPDHRWERVLPTGTVQLVIRLHQERIFRFDDRGQNRIEFEYGVIDGAHSRPFVKQTYRHSSVIGVQFRPAAAAVFFAAPFGPLMNLHVAAEDLWGPQVRSLREKLLETSSPQAMFDVVEAALIRRMTNPSSQLQIILRAVDRFVGSPTLAKVRDVGDATGYRPKRFIKLFENYVGLTPKVFCRVLRFQAVLDRIAVRQEVDWAKTAVDCGYFDQSHLIRDFREFAGICPSEYRPVKPDRQNHVAVNPLSNATAAKDNFFQSAGRGNR